MAPERVGPGDDLAPPQLPGGGVGGDVREGLVHGPGGQAQVGRPPARPAEPREGRQQAPLQVERERRLIGGAAGLLDADRGRLD